MTARQIGNKIVVDQNPYNVSRPPNLLVLEGQFVVIAKEEGQAAILTIRPRVGRLQNKLLQRSEIAPRVIFNGNCCIELRVLPGSVGPAWRSIRCDQESNDDPLEN